MRGSITGYSIIILLQRVADALGISERTVRNIKLQHKETGEVSSPKKYKQPTWRSLLKWKLEILSTTCIVIVSNINLHTATENTYKT